LPKCAKNATFVKNIPINTHILLIFYFKKKPKLNYFFIKKEKRKKNDKYKINPCGWHKLQIAHYGIKNNSKIFILSKIIII
jgi:hypothetical protein